jgi:uncharacterized membrane protein YphA (DoxX/SURF4 family)
MHRRPRLALRLSGRLLFGTAIAGFGLVSVLFADFVRQLQPVSQFVAPETPGYGTLATMNGLALIAVGIALVADIRTRPVAVGLAGFFAAWIVGLQVPSAFLDPGLLRSPWWVRTFETVALLGASLVLAGLAGPPARERWVRVGRRLFGASLPVFGVLHFIYAENVASLVPGFYPWPLFLAYFTGATKSVAGAAIALGVLPRLAAILVAVQYAVYAATLHIPRQFMDQPAGYQPNGITSLFVAVGFCGAALTVAGSLGPSERAPDA